MFFKYSNWALIVQSSQIVAKHEAGRVDPVAILENLHVTVIGHRSAVQAMQTYNSNRYTQKIGTCVEM